MCRDSIPEVFTMDSWRRIVDCRSLSPLAVFVSQRADLLTAYASSGGASGRELHNADGVLLHRLGRGWSALFSRGRFAANREYLDEIGRIGEEIARLRQNTASSRVMRA